MVNRHQALVGNLRSVVLGAPGATEPGDREAAFRGEDLPASLSPYVEMVREQSYRITRREIDALLEAGLSQDAIFELTVAAAVGAAVEHLDSALRAVALSE